MALDHFIAPSVPDAAAVTVRYGAGSGSGNQLTQAEVGKFAKLVAESRYDNCAVGNVIEGVVYAVEIAPQNGFTIASVLNASGTRLSVTFDGLQATPGTGVATIGAIVVAGTVTAKGTKLAANPKVCVATTPANVVHKWRVVSLGSAGTGAVGTAGVIERI